MTLQLPIVWVVAARNLVRHRLRSTSLVVVVTFVTTLLIILAGVFHAMQENLLLSATALMSGHVNVAGFYKPTQSQSAPVVVDYEAIQALVEKEVPEVDYIVDRGRGYAKLVSDSHSIQVGIYGIDINNEPGFRKVVHLASGSLDGLTREDGIVIFDKQAEKLGVKVGDRLTYAAPTPRGTNNTIDVTVVAIAKSMGILSIWNTYMNFRGLRKLYQLNDNTTGAIQVYLKDHSKTTQVAERLRKSLAAAGYELMDPLSQPFFFKFDAVNREAWTGQHLDVTTWEDETSFVNWFMTIIGFIFTLVIVVLVTLISVGIMNVMYIAIRERTREIGTLRAIGMQRTSLLGMFLAEGFLIGAVGTLLGLVCGVVIAKLINSAHIELPNDAKFMLMNDYLTVSPSLFILGASVAFITGVITLVSIQPSLKAARMKPISAMSHIG